MIELKSDKEVFRFERLPKIGLDMDIFREEIINVFKIPKEHFNCRCTIDDHINPYEGTWPVYKIETEDIDYEDVTHKRLDK